MESLKKTRWFIEKMIKRYQSHNLSATSAYISYYWILAFFPFLIFVISILTYTKLPTGIFMQYMEKILPSVLIPQLEATIRQFISYRSTTLISVGGLITLWTSGTAVNALIRGIHSAYNSTYVRSFVFSRLLAIAYTILLALLLIVLMVGIIFGNRIGDYLFRILDMNQGIFMPIWNMARLVMPFIALVVVIFIMYRFIPRKYIKYTNVWPGVIFTSAGWYIYSFVFSIYVDNYSKYNQLYGSIGSVFILLIWLYGSSTLLLIGAEINALIQELHMDQVERRFS